MLNKQYDIITKCEALKNNGKKMCNFEEIKLFWYFERVFVGISSDFYENQIPI